jgi:hypothetical protein
MWRRGLWGTFLVWCHGILLDGWLAAILKLLIRREGALMRFKPQQPIAIMVRITTAFK